MKKQVPLKIEEATFDKLKYVAWFDRTTVTAMLTEDANKRIAKFEKEHGSITPAMLKKMEDAK